MTIVKVTAIVCVCGHAKERHFTSYQVVAGACMCALCECRKFRQKAAA